MLGLAFCKEKKMKFRFECQICGGHELGYQKYAKCITPVSLQEDGHIEYASSLFDEDDYIFADNTFICMNCKAYIVHCGYRMISEKDLLDYLELDPDVRDKQQQEHQEQLDIMDDVGW